MVRRTFRSYLYSVISNFPSSIDPMTPVSSCILTTPTLYISLNHKLFHVLPKGNKRNITLIHLRSVNFFRSLTHHIRRHHQISKTAIIIFIYLTSSTLFRVFSQPLPALSSKIIYILLSPTAASILLLSIHLRHPSRFTFPAHPMPSGFCH